MMNNTMMKTCPFYFHKGVRRSMREPSEIVHYIQTKFQHTKDLTVHEFSYFKEQIFLVYFYDLCDGKKIKTDIIQSLLLCDTVSKFQLHLLSLPNSERITYTEQIEKDLLGGHALIFLNKDIYSYGAIKEINNTPSESSVEKSVQGPQLGFCEDLNTNITLLRRRFPSTNLKVERQTVGTISKTEIALIYDVEYVQEEVLTELKRRLAAIKTDVIQAAGQLQNALTEGKYYLFPTMMLTERPDRVTLNLTQGKIAILINGTPFCVVLPTVFFDFLSAMDDLYQSFWVKKLMLVLRYSGLLITLTLPALYVAITAYNPEILRSQLALTIAGSRAAVPYPAFLEVIFMLLVVEMLVEASIRLPTTIGATATTVGGLILGQAAQQAELVSSIMIIITAFVAISNFTIPINAMSFAVRFTRYPLLILASFFGFIGLVGGMFVLLCYFVNARSFGKPFLALYWGSTKEIETISEDPKGGNG